MPPLGAHMSIAGGYYKAVDAAAELGMDVVQIFTKNNNQWRAKPLTDEDVERFQQALAEGGVGQPVAHSSYLLNLASPDQALWEKSCDALVVELRRATRLGLIGLVMHPGSHTTSTEEEGLARVAAGIDRVFDEILSEDETVVPLLLENTAGQGSNLGWKFEHLGEIIGQSRHEQYLRVCLDTCHTFAAGYPLADRKDYLATFKAFDQAVGIDRVAAFHLNDSKKPFGSRVDRHEHIGEGELGLEPFRHLLNDRRFSKVPMYLETPKGDRDGTNLDAMNLATLLSLIEKKGAKKPVKKTAKKAAKQPAKK